MAGIALKRRRWAPGPDTAINWSHPLAHGLSDFYVFDGSTYVCLVKGDRMIREAGLGASTYALGRAGSSTAVNAGAYRQLVPSTSIGTYPASFTWVGQSLGTSSNGTTLFAINAQPPTNVTDNDPFLWGIDRGSTQPRLFHPNGNTWNGNFLSGTAMTTGNLTVVVGVTNTGDQRLYQNGILTASNTLTLSNPVIADPYLGISTYMATRNGNERSAVGMIHRRSLTAGDAAALYADPFCMLKG